MAYLPVEKYADSDAITVQGKISQVTDKSRINKEISFNIDLQNSKQAAHRCLTTHRRHSASNIKRSQHMKIKQAVDLTNKITDYIEAQISQ
ncbi:MAG: hypothetical protein R3B45_06750 [Bdellovibrionota bacterium]